MRFSPRFMGWLYCFIGSIFTYFAIQNVKLSGWNFFTYFLIALAAIDYMISIRFFTASSKQQNKK